VLPLLPRLLRPGGCLLYHTFMRGAERFGAPRRPRFLLEPGEFMRVFGDLHVIEYREETIEDGRPVACVLAQLPETSS
jgi:hypothetical protein